MQMYRITFMVSFAGVHQFALVVHPDAKVSAVFDKAAFLSRGKPCRIRWSEVIEVEHDPNKASEDSYYVGP